MDIVRLRAGSIGAVDGSDLPDELCARVRLHPGERGRRAIVCENAEQYAKIGPVRQQLDFLDRIVTIEGTPGSALGLDELRRRGGRTAVVTAIAPSRNAEMPDRRDDVLTIIYTSGPPGPRRAVSSPTGDFASMVDMVGCVADFFTERRPRAALSPARPQLRPARAIRRIGSGFAVALLPGDRSRSPARCSSLADDPAERSAALREGQAGVSESIRRDDRSRTPTRRLGAPVGQEPPALAAGRDHACPRLSPSSTLLPTGSCSRRSRPAGRRAALRGLGRRAAWRVEVAEFFHALGLLILEGYGLTECTTASHVNRPGALPVRNRRPPARRRRVRLADDGEILLRGARRVRRLLTATSEATQRGPRRRRLAAQATSARSTRTASSRSQTGRRRSSSRPAGRTSRRRRSRMRSRHRGSSRRPLPSVTNGRTSSP